MKTINGVTVSDELIASHTPRELAALSQLDRTPDHTQALKYAAAAYLGGLGSKTDPTIAGEAAAKAGLRGALADKAKAFSDEWFISSYGALDSLYPQPTIPPRTIERERAATYLLHGRALGIYALRTTDADEASQLRKEASGKFVQGDKIIHDQHVFRDPWDRYATMLSRHWAVNEALRGKPLHALTIAARGVTQAIRANQEIAGFEPTPEEASAHKDFVSKHVSANLAAAALILTRGQKRDALVAGLTGFNPTAS